MSRSLLDEMDLAPGLLSALARRGRERRLASELADAEWRDGLWVEEAPSRASGVLLRLAADDGGAGRFATNPPLALPDGSRLRVTLEPTQDGAWIATVERLVEGASGRPAVFVRVSPSGDGADVTLSLPSGEDVVASLAIFHPGPSPIISAELET